MKIIEITTSALGSKFENPLDHRDVPATARYLIKNGWASEDSAIRMADRIWSDLVETGYADRGSISWRVAE